MTNTIDIDEFTNFILKFMDDTMYFLGEHCRQTAEIGLAIADKLDIGTPEREILKYGSLLHDIGKIYIPKAILLAPRKLTDKEFEIVKEHPVLGLMMVKQFKFMGDLSPFILYHHYRNGFGYPDKLSCELNIDPVLIDILSVSDSYTAIKERRVYNDGTNVDAIKILKDENDIKNRGINQDIVDILAIIP